MEFNEKLQELRKRKGLTQEELAQQLYVSRTAISKWESAKGYPNIDSLKEISKYFSVTIDDLLSGEEILNIAEADNKQKEKYLKDLVFGLLDIAVATFFFMPIFGLNNAMVPIIAYNFGAARSDRVKRLDHCRYFADGLDAGDLRGPKRNQDPPEGRKDRDHRI